MHYANYKTIISPQNNMNIYRGCTHGCIYCDSRSKCYQIKHSFEDIEIKKSAPEILHGQLERKRKKCMITTGAMCDPYIHIEESLKITRQCISIINDYGFGLSILTKSTRILRDFELLKSINNKAKCVVQLTLTTLDESLCKKIEPNVSTTIERVNALNIFGNENIPTVVWLGPILPFINDTEENLRGILDYCIKAKVKGILCFGFGMTLRDGSREYFYDQLDKLFPNLKEKYIASYGNNYICNSPSHHQLMDIFVETCRSHNIMYKPKDIFAYINNFEKEENQLSFF